MCNEGLFAMTSTAHEESSLQTQREKDCIRELTRQVAELAHEPRMETIRRRWCNANGLRKTDRAPVWCFISGCWHEFLPEESLVCQEPERRSVEFRLRQFLTKRDIGDDTPIEPWFEVPAIYHVQPENVWGVDIAHHLSNAQGGAWAYDPPLKTEKDFDKLRLPVYTFDAARSMAMMDRLQELMGDILPLKSIHVTPLSACVAYWAAELRGLEQIMLDAVMEPELLHRLMAHIRDAMLQWLDMTEANSLVTPYTIDPTYYSDPIGSPKADGSYTFKNCWSHASAQELDQVSPAMWEEFSLAYQQPIMERFGLIHYGCCESLTRKLDGVLTIPNLRIVTCSAWTDLDTVLERVSEQYVIMWRQKASEVIFADDVETLRPGLESGARRLHDRPHQIILREIETMAGNMDRLHEWTRIAIETAEKYA